MNRTRNLFIRLAIVLSFMMAFLSTPIQAKETTVVLYGTSWCTYCKQVREYLKSQNVSFTDYDIENSEEGKRKFQEVNGQGVPLIFVGSTRLDGFDRGNLHSALKQHGLVKK
jgi:glutaredoxin